MRWDFWNRARDIAAGLPGTPLAKLTHDASPQSLKDAFRHAAFGTECWTQSYPNTAFPDRTEWLEAHRSSVTGAGWVILRKNLDPNHFSGRPVVEQKESARGLTFFDAVEYLARYEASQLARGIVAIDLGEASALGDRHFIAFAKREGIVFDTDFMPHPTDGGRIVTPGSFAEQDYGGAIAANDRKQSHFNQNPAAFLDPQEFQQKRTDCNGYIYVRGLFAAALETLQAICTADDQMDDTAWFVEIAGKHSSQIFSDNWGRTGELLHAFLKQKYEESVPVYVAPLVDRLRYEFMVVNTANVMLRIEQSDFKEKHEDYYTASRLKELEGRAIRCLSTQAFHGDVAQQVFRDIHAAHHDLKINKNKTATVRRFEEAFQYLDHLIQFQKQELGLYLGGGEPVKPPVPPKL